MNMPNTVPNQKVVCIHKASVTENFLQISIDDWMNANKTLTPYGLQLYLYLASNANNYNLALSPAAAEMQAGIKRTSFSKYLKLLEMEGYLVWKQGNIYDFYTSPVSIEKRTNPDEHEKIALSPDEQGISFREF